MNPKKTIEKLEHDLSHFLIGETCKADPTKRGTPELYKYKGLNISADARSKAHEKTIFVRIGPLEAEFNINTCEKNSGCLHPDDERLVKIWLNKRENQRRIDSIFAKRKSRKTIPIIPFDLEEYYL